MVKRDNVQRSIARVNLIVTLNDLLPLSPDSSGKLIIQFPSSAGNLTADHVESSQINFLLEQIL